MNCKYKPGDKVGNLTIISLHKSKISTNRGCVYKCLCDCGSITMKTAGYLYVSRVNNCGCHNPSKMDDRENQIIKRLIKEKMYNTRTRHGNVSFFSLTFDQFKEIIKKPCFYCGISHSMERKDMVKDKVSTDTVLRYNGIDRIENEIGYTVENSVPCCTL